LRRREPEAAGRAIDEYLAVLDDAAFGVATEVTPKFVSPSDPAARWTGAHSGQAFFVYSTNYLVDVENAIIVDVEATTAIRQAEVIGAAIVMALLAELAGSPTSSANRVSAPYRTHGITWSGI
jgi:hypothetical protein